MKFLKIVICLLVFLGYLGNMATHFLGYLGLNLNYFFKKTFYLECFCSQDI